MIILYFLYYHYFFFLNFQSVWERIKWAISTFKSIDLNSNFTSNDLRYLLQSICEGNYAVMTYIYEGSKEEEDDESQQSESIVNPLISSLLPFDELSSEC